MALFVHTPPTMAKFGLGAVLLGLLSVGCSDAGDEPRDGEDEAFVVDGKSDVFGIAEGSAKACAVRKLAALASFDELDDDVKLNRQAVAKIVAYRDGRDKLATTSDDELFETLAELDAVKYVGKASFTQMVKYVGKHPEYACGQVAVQLLAFNDFHGNLKPPSGSSGVIVTGANPAVDKVDAGGAEFLATHLVTRAATNPNTLIVAAGDIIGATPLLSAAFHDEPTIEAMNRMGLAITSVGNHEFDEGTTELLRMQNGGCHPVDGCQDGDGFDGSAFEYLAANVRETGATETILPAYTIRRFGNAQIAFIGLTLEGTPLVTTAQGVEGLTFGDEVETVNALVPQLKARGVQSIVVLLHEGGASTGLYNECLAASGPVVAIASGLDPAVDVVVTGHTHKAYNCVIGGKIVTSAAHAGRIITDIDLAIDENTGDVVGKQAENVIVTRTVAKDPGQTALIAKYETLIAPIANRVVGSITGDLDRAVIPTGETRMGDVIADAQLDGTRALGAVAAVMNPGGIRTDVLVAQLSGGEQAGQVTHSEAFAVQPFGNTMVVLDITGAQLDTLLEQQWAAGAGGVEKVNLLAVSSSLHYAFTPTLPIGSRVDAASITIDGVVVDPAATYRIAANNFLADGGDGFAVLKLGTNRVPGPGDLDAFEAYLAARSPLAPPALDRVTLRP